MCTDFTRVTCVPSDRWDAQHSRQTKQPWWSDTLEVEVEVEVEVEEDIEAQMRWLSTRGWRQSQQMRF